VLPSPEFDGINDVHSHPDYPEYRCPERPISVGLSLKYVVVYW